MNEKASNRTRPELAIVFALVGCAPTPSARPAETTTVPIASAALTDEPASVPKRALGVCVVRGDGAATDDSWIQMFGDAAASDPWIEIATSVGLVLAWTIEPEGPRPTFRVAIGKQKTARVEGWAKQPRLELWFRRDTALLDQRVFARKGDTLDAFVRSENDQLLVAQAAYIESPKSIEAKTPCRGLRWGKVAADGTLKVTGTPRGIVGQQLFLFAEPDSGDGMELRFSADYTVYELAKRDDWVKINFSAGPIFQGWVKAASLTDAPPSGGRGGYGHGTRAPRLRFSKKPVPIATVQHDTPLYVGKRDATSSEPREIGIVEEGAVVRVLSANGRLVAFRFDHGWVQAVDSLELFLDPKDLGPIREEDRGGSWAPPPVPVVNEEEAD